MGGCLGGRSDFLPNGFFRNTKKGKTTSPIITPQLHALFFSSDLFFPPRGLRRLLFTLDRARTHTHLDPYRHLSTNDQSIYQSAREREKIFAPIFRLTKIFYPFLHTHTHFSTKSADREPDSTSFSFALADANPIWKSSIGANLIRKSHYTFFARFQRADTKQRFRHTFTSVNCLHGNEDEPFFGTMSKRAW